MIKLFLVIPCYKEQEVLPETSARLKRKMQQMIEQNRISPASRVVFFKYGSKDKKRENIQENQKEYRHLSGIDLSRNRGHQNALLAGLMTVKDIADVTISMDADLQDDIDAIDQMLDQYFNGCDIVYGVRSKRQTDTFFKRFTAESFYHLMRWLGADIVFNHADYRLMSQRALQGLSQFKEVNLFLRGLVPLVGYRSGIVTYERHERFAGESKYPLKKMLAFAVEGITALSTRPIRFISQLGVGIFLFSIFMLLYFLLRYFTGNTVTGWASIAVSVWAIGGLQLLAIGVIGEYIGKIYLESKSRPRYIIEQFLHEEG